MRDMKRVLWALEALNRLRDTLQQALDTADEAAETLCRQIHSVSRDIRRMAFIHFDLMQRDADIRPPHPQCPGRRSEALEHICQDYLEEFDKKRSILRTAFAEIGRKIELNCRYRDEMFNLLSLEDNRAAFQQNSYIQRLTVLTIVYLPVSLTTVGTLRRNVTVNCIYRLLTEMCPGHLCHPRRRRRRHGRGAVALRRPLVHGHHNDSPDGDRDLCT